MMHYYPHHIGDFIKETANLNDHQLATYLRMVWGYYLDEKPFDNDCESIAFAVRSDEKTVRLLLKHYFELTDDKWHQKRCDREIEHYRSNSEKGRKAAEARWNKHNQKQQTQSNSNADAMHMHTKTDANATFFNANQEPRTKNHINTKAATGVAKPDGVSKELWSEFNKICKSKNKPIGELVLKKLYSEADKAGWSIDRALTWCCEKGYARFEAEWVKTDTVKPMTVADMEKAMFK
jgi:uncharacterized protein YdaU (DUF1376 family)